MLSYDIMALFVVLALPNEYALDVEYWWGCCDDTGVNMFKPWSNISLQQKIVFQRDSCDHFLNNEEIVSCEWTLELSVNYFDGIFIKSNE